MEKIGGTADNKRQADDYSSGNDDSDDYQMIGDSELNPILRHWGGRFEGQSSIAYLKPLVNGKSRISPARAWMIFVKGRLDQLGALAPRFLPPTGRKKKRYLSTKGSYTPNQLLPK